MRIHHYIASYSESNCKRFAPVLALLLSAQSFLYAQNSKVSVDLKGGLTFATMAGPSEKAGSTRIVEEFSYLVGLHGGVGLHLELTNYTGLQIELLYNQKGTHYSYSGQSYWLFPTLAGETVFSFGTRKMELSILNSYLELPLLYSVRVGRVEMSAGLGMSFLLRSKGKGELLYSGLTESGALVLPFKAKLDFDYLHDPIRRVSYSENFYRTLDGQVIDIPQTMSAYYETSGIHTRRFHRLDAQLVGGISFFLSETLFLDLRINYGVGDVTNNRQDVSLTQVDRNRVPVTRNDYDQNFAFLASVGLRF
ncbi:MAG: outer membrane beta-barrel protein [Saprospiraceae bacterium]|nr:outer membrane beta-barrel protein [Saprospiraceae bacterium]